MAIAFGGDAFLTCSGLSEGSKRIIRKAGLDLETVKSASRPATFPVPVSCAAAQFHQRAGESGRRAGIAGETHGPQNGNRASRLHASRIGKTPRRRGENSVASLTPAGHYQTQLFEFVSSRRQQWPILKP